jgi:hypothetical protein
VKLKEISSVLVLVVVGDLQGAQILKSNSFAVKQRFDKTRQLHFYANNEKEMKIMN